ncbi:MAG TPA: hypothetical protein VGN02_12820 [Paenibacillus sp.]
MLFTLLILASALGLIIGQRLYRQVRTKVEANPQLSRLAQPLVGSLTLFVGNMAIFALIWGLLLVLTYVSIPYIHMLLPVLGVTLSIFFWQFIRTSWQGLGKRRIGMALVGNSFYLILFLYAVIQFITIKPAFEGDDTFMRAFGMVLLGFIALVAYIISLILTLRPQKIR